MRKQNSRLNHVAAALVAVVTAGAAAPSLSLVVVVDVMQTKLGVSAESGSEVHVQRH